MITWTTIIAAAAGYLLRQWDPFHAHAPVDPLTAALKATQQAQQQQAIAEALARLQQAPTAAKAP